ncbi:MAG: pyridoxamine 5'-phosphate oxidase family protein [Ruminococcus sp.]|nr:pyridoxamine 5'-phosphate oxidase family protein [Ruminococcus sp.]
MLPDNVKKVFEENLWYIATGGDEPNVVPVGFKRVCEDGRLAIGAVLLETTLENIKANGRAAVAAANPLTGEAYQIKGTAELVTEGEAYEHYKKLTEDTFKGSMQLRCAVIISPERLINASPNEHNKEEIEI